MGKIDEKIVDDYINGEPFDERIIEKMENSCSFMKKAIEKSNDYRLYNLCSNRVKTNFEFVKYLILKFRNNLDFICNVADYYLNNTKDELNNIEIIVIMCELTTRDADRNIHYLMQAEAIYQYERLRVEVTKNKENDDIANEIGMGFYFIFDTYSNNPRVLNFYARKIIYGIFDEYGLNLEKILHEQFKETFDIDKMGINTFLLKFISTYDVMLASYISVHIELLQEMKNIVKDIQKRWDRYNESIEREKYLELFDKVHEYLDDSQDGLLCETTLLYYIGKQLGIEEKIFKYDNLFDDTIDEVLNDIDEKYIKDILEYSFQDRIVIRDIKKIMIDTVIRPRVKEDYHVKKIIRVNFGKDRM